MNSFSDLQTALLNIATDLCGGTVIVHKLVDGNAAPGWHFSAPGGTPTPATGDTAADGTVNFAWDSPQSQTTDLTETLTPGYAFVSASCALKNGNATGSPITNGVHLSVGPLDTVQCTFNNRTLTAGIHVDKTASPTVMTSGGLRHLHLCRHQHRRGSARQRRA